MFDCEYELTEEDIGFFKKEVAYWRDFHGLHRFRIYVGGDTLVSENTVGETLVDPVSKTADITINTAWQRKPTKKEISCTAFHEIWEILLFSLRTKGADYFNWDIIDSDVHEVICMTENVYFEKLWKERKIK